MVQVAVADIARLSSVHPDTAQAEGFARLARAAMPNGSLSASVGGVSVTVDRLAAAAGARLNSEASALREAAGNAAEGVAALQEADRGLAEIDTHLEELVSLATQASSGTIALSTVDRARLDVAFDATRTEIDKIAAGTTFGNLSLLAGGTGPGGALEVDIKVGTSTDPIDTVTLSLAPAGVADLSADLATATLSSTANATTALADAEAARDALDLRRGAVSGDLQRLSTAARAAQERAEIVDAAGRDRAAPEISVDFALLLAERVAEEGGVDLSGGPTDLFRGLLLSLDDPRPTLDEPRPANEPTQANPTPAPSRAAPTPILATEDDG